MRKLIMIAATLLAGSALADTATVKVYSLDVKGVVACLTACFSQFDCCAPYIDRISEGSG